MIPFEMRERCCPDLADTLNGRVERRGSPRAETLEIKAKLQAAGA